MRRRLFSSLPFLTFLLTPLPYSQNSVSISPRRALITQAVDNQKRVALPGNTKSAANSANDLGRVSDGLSMDHMQLQLNRPPELQQALDRYTEDLQNPASPNYHRWLTAADLGQRFGVAQADIAAVTNWLESQGFVVNQVYPNNVTIDFSGTAGQLRQAFRTEIHHLNLNGEAHLANMSDPEIPAALASVIAGIVSLHDFRPHPMKTARTEYTFLSGGSTEQAVVPADLATIYNLNRLFAAGITGKGQTIAVIEDTNVYSTADWTTFRNTFGLSAYTSASFTQIQPGGCANPGVVAGADGEAILDAEWASASAPGASIQLASCRDTRTTFGGLIALQNLLNASTAPPALVSISYGECEAENGAAANKAYSMTYQQAVSEGVSVFVSAGDQGAASCDAGGNYASHGVGVNAFASTPYNVAVGGTDFGDNYAGTASRYWSATNSASFGSALSYIPEIPWNTSCASSLIATTLGYSTAAGPGGFCNSSMGKNDFLNTAAGSGGPSGCATGRPLVAGVVGGSCAGYTKPSWQAGAFGNPADGVRDIPDVSLFAANGVWGHFLVYCWSDLANGGASCSGAPSSWSGAGGTSFSSPIMAGIQALVNQKTGDRSGNPNPAYYALAAQEHRVSGESACDSSNPNIDSRCTIYDVTQGDNDVVCDGLFNCYGSSTSLTGRRASVVYGALSTSTGSLAPAYGATLGWDFSTGLGSVNAVNLVTNWPAAPVIQP